jgi:hypothetical protein
MEELVALALVGFLPFVGASDGSVVSGIGSDGDDPGGDTEPFSPAEGGSVVPGGANEGSNDFVGGPPGRALPSVGGVRVAGVFVSGEFALGGELLAGGGA